MATACGPLDTRKPDTTHAGAEPPAAAPAHIIATERGPRGGRLVLIAESGERMGDLTELGSVPVRDNSPAWSPDGRFVVFVSSRGRNNLIDTSLWIIAARSGQKPRRLTHDASVDRDPTWTPDGRAIVFASDRGGSFDLWKLELEPGNQGWPAPAGAPSQLTQGPDHDLHPSVSPDGQRIVHMRLAADGSRSSLWLWSQGQSTQLTRGPADMTPAWSRDGKTIAFAAPTEPDANGKGADAQAPTHPDADLYAIQPDGKGRRLIVREPLGDQTGPVWSADGSYLFATSVYRSVATGKPVLSSVTFVDLGESPPVVRALHDPMVVEARTSPALDRAPLDASLLRQNLVYKEALRRAVEQELVRSQGSTE